MRQVDSKIFSCRCSQLYSLVADVERYPRFLPGWSRVRILHADDNRLEVEQQLQLGLFRVRFHSTAKLEPCRRIVITSSDAPFGEMTIEWRFAPRPGDHCEVSLIVELALHSGPLKRPLQQFLKHGNGELLRRFENRAREIYGGGG